jgi:hypothetical protein
LPELALQRVQFAGGQGCGPEGDGPVIDPDDVLNRYNSQIEEKLTNPGTKLVVRMIFSLKQFLEGNDDNIDILDMSYMEIIEYYQQKEKTEK